jgi:O-acetylserine/cysteine efflux transporter
MVPMPSPYRSETSSPPLSERAYTAVFASLVGSGIWNRLLAKYSPSAVVPVTMLVPVVGMSAWLALQEVPSATEVAGGLLLLGGVATAVLARSGGRIQRQGPALPPVLPPVLAPASASGLRVADADEQKPTATVGVSQRKTVPELT